jgi:hypothetical protein
VLVKACCVYWVFKVCCFYWVCGQIFKYTSPKLLVAYCIMSNRGGNQAGWFRFEWVESGQFDLLEEIRSDRVRVGLCRVNLYVLFF